MIGATLVYVFVSALAALATPILGGSRAPAIIWGAGALVLIAVLVRTPNGTTLAPDRPQPIGRVLMVVLVGVIAAFFAFVVMVNIWERLGIPH